MFGRKTEFVKFFYFWMCSVHFCIKLLFETEELLNFNRLNLFYVCRNFEKNKKEQND